MAEKICSLKNRGSSGGTGMKAVCYLNGVLPTILNIETGTVTQGPDGGSTTNGNYTWSRTSTNVITFKSSVDCKAYLFSSGGMTEHTFRANVPERVYVYQIAIV